jgi:hypothetical protein
MVHKSPRYLSYIARTPRASLSKCVQSLKDMTRRPLPGACGRQNDHASSHHMEDAAPDDCDTLPCYESLKDLPPATASTPPESTNNSMGSDRGSAQQGHSYTLSEYFNQYDQGFELKMAPIYPTLDLDILDYPTRHWAAVLLVKTRDMFLV